MTKSRNIGQGGPGISRSMKVSHTEAERLMREWWPNRDLTKRDMCERLGVSKAWLERLAKRWGLLDRRASQFKQRMPVMVRGKVFDDADACAKHFGLHVQTVRTMVCRGDADRIGLGADRSQARWNPRAKPLHIGPYRWPSQNAAAAALGFRSCRMSRLLAEGRTDEIIARVMQMQVQQERAAA